MLEAIDVLKGVLALEETPCRGSARNSHDTGLIQSRSTSQSLAPDQKPRTVSVNVQSKRARAPSDPFLDTPTSAASSPLHDNSVVVDSSTADRMEDFVSKIRELVAPDHEDQALEEECMRIWTSPAHLTNPELLKLLEVFPAFVSRRTLPRFSLVNSRDLDLEEGEDETPEGKRIHFGTGSMWVSSKERADGWNGGWWTRFILWWRHLFC